MTNFINLAVVILLVNFNTHSSGEGMVNFILNGEYRYFMPPMVSIVGIIEEDTRDITGKNKGPKNESQMLRRKKPLPRHTNSLSSLVSKI